MGFLEKLNWGDVRQLYDARAKASKNLQELYESKAINSFTDVALGIANPDGNYSAAEHGLGPKILSTNIDAKRRVFDLAGEFKSLTEARRVPEIIRRAQITYL